MFELPALPYAHNALEPHIDARTMEIHHGKHHQAYVNNLNNAVKGNAAKVLNSLNSFTTSQNTVQPSAITVAVIGTTVSSGESWDPTQVVSLQVL